MALTVVTGSNRGIGLEFCRALSERGDTVIAACRRASIELQSLPVEVVEGVDVTDEASIQELVMAVGERSIDLLINNAGVLMRETLDDLRFDQIRYQFEVNALGSLRVTAALKNRLAQGSKVALITSRMGSIGDNSSGARYGYRMSKAALNMAGVSLSHDLRERGVSVVLLHPGYVQTEMTGHTGQLSAKEAVQGLLSRIDELSLETSGAFFHSSGERLPW